MKNTKNHIIVLALLSLTATGFAQQTFYSREIAHTAMSIWKDSVAPDGKPALWTYDQGVLLDGITTVWKQTADPVYFRYIQESMDYFITEDGNIRTYRPTEFNIDLVKNGTCLLTLYRVTGNEKYWKAATRLREQLLGQPRTKEGGFWHKKIYPYQMWLDGLYMGEPFYAEYAMLAHQDTAFEDIANQFIWMENHVRDRKTGLLFHGWDESKQMSWANKETGQSPNFWARAVGWYVMALVDVLENFPAGHAKRKTLIDILNRAVDAIAKVQDPTTGLWYDILNMPREKGNYFEASASCMFVYAVAKGVRMGWIVGNKLNIAERGFQGILKNFIKTENGHANLYGTVKVSGLGGTPFRDGSIAYYLGEPVIVNDPKGMGAFIKAAAEMEMIPDLKIGKGKTVLLDYYFNHETKKDITGATVQYHYIWEEMDNGGFAMLGDVFNGYGVKTKRLEGPVNAEELKEKDIYLIVDPDWPQENKNPNYIEPEHVETICKWVENGGVLLLFANDSNNVEFKHYNELAGRFGIHFNENSRNRVKGAEFGTGTFIIGKEDSIFKTAKKIYLKEICTLSINPPARSALTDQGDVIMAVSKVGKGTVFAVGDPWFYNEYLDGRKLPMELENFKAAKDLVLWLIKQSNK